MSTLSGDLQLQAARREACCAQDLTHRRRQIGLLQLARRQIDADHQRRIARMRVLPLAGLATRRLEHPAAKRHDQASLFGQRNGTPPAT